MSDFNPNLFLLWLMLSLCLGHLFIPLLVMDLVRFRFVLLLWVANILAFLVHYNLISIP